MERALVWTIVGLLPSAALAQVHDIDAETRVGYGLGTGWAWLWAALALVVLLLAVAAARWGDIERAAWYRRFRGHPPFRP